MPASISEVLTTQFYQWELLGRGWLVFDKKVEPEPPFTPFFGHFCWRDEPYRDDGHRHNALSWIASAFKKTKANQPANTGLDVSYSPILMDQEEEQQVLEIFLQKGQQFPVQQMEAFFSMASYCTFPMSYERVASAERIVLQFTAAADYFPYLKAQLNTYFPSLHMVEASDALESVRDYRAYATVDFGLEQEFVRPLTIAHSIDPLTGIFSLFEHLGKDQLMVLQVLFNGLVNRWESSMLRCVSRKEGGCFFEDAPEMLPLARQKVSKPLFAAALRVAVFDQHLSSAHKGIQEPGFAVKRSFRSSSNALIHLSGEAYSARKGWKISFCAVHIG